ncbi:hypothetical protein GGU11DRAFT_750198 [Lentinula aff. detonsa]|uniref:Uncharacterized protein n=1 Tax=Lentinula aff. detonsa TaxID=2804958 RepID=A0AA38TZ94_9AGAR|nr:hypothetical protein GGU10DRAFT_342235 [Lentinula aff. detonsa]KAJ3792309.1 hypothetical protein GGU11DRAFT_750198 [Lentinula aff. detonsa]
MFALHRSRSCRPSFDFHIYVLAIVSMLGLISLACARPANPNSLNITSTPPGEPPIDPHSSLLVQRANPLLPCPKLRYLHHFGGIPDVTRRAEVFLMIAQVMFVMDQPKVEAVNWKGTTYFEVDDSQGRLLFTGRVWGSDFAKPYGQLRDPRNWEQRPPEGLRPQTREDEVVFETVEGKIEVNRLHNFHLHNVG